MKVTQIKVSHPLYVNKLTCGCGKSFFLCELSQVDPSCQTELFGHVYLSTNEVRHCPYCGKRNSAVADSQDTPVFPVHDIISEEQ
jgi:hypothetical protein